MESNTTSNISYNTITQQILDGSISLEDITYDQFLEGREIYYSYYSAQKEGYEAHHYNPVALQIKEYNKKHPENPFIGNKHTFFNLPEADNRCYRLTSFEHIVAHYLLAKENPDALVMFNIMTSYAETKISDNEREKVEQFENIAEFRQKAYQDSKYEKPKVWNMKDVTGDPDWESPWKTENPSKYYKYTDDKRQYYYYNNGIIEKAFYENDIIPEGWIKGRLNRNKYHWYNNGNVNVFAIECPEGFKRGRMIKNPLENVKTEIIYPEGPSLKYARNFIRDFLYGRYGKCINHQTGEKEFLKWYTDGKNVYLFSVNDDIPENFKIYKPEGKIDISAGRKLYNDGRFNIQSYIKPYNFERGYLKEEKPRKRVCNNGIYNIRINEDQPTPEGFVDGGRPHYSRRGKSTVTGRLWSNDGVKNYYEKYIPEGCKPGRLPFKNR